MSIAERAVEIRGRIADAAVKAGRNVEDITLIGVSKTHPVERLQEALDAGVVHLGENYGQHLRDKARELGERPRWHFIGPVQRNKAKYIAPVAWRVHTVDRVEVAEALVRRAPAGIDGLVPVNIGREESKAGLMPEQVLEVVRDLTQVEGLRIRGLMCLPPWREDPEEVSPWFAETAALLARCQEDGHDMSELSMGMSSDFEVAIRHGATFVRVGTALFGARATRPDPT